MVTDALAVVVSYNGRQRTLRAVEALRLQVGHVHVVDNGSDAESQRILREVSYMDGVTVEWLGANHGIGYALNRGVAAARAGGCRWLLTMDQDSVPDPSMVAAYQRAYERDPQLVCLAPTMDKNGLGTEQGGGVAYAVTSGNLVRTDLFDEVGLYDEGMFIDCVDFDFSLRVRRAGHRIRRVDGARMIHELGEATELPRFVRRFYARHSPGRRYYMYRNFGYLVRRYAVHFPGFILKLAALQTLLAVLVGVFDPHPLRSYRAIGRGIRDCFAHRTGPDPQRVL